MGLKKIKMFIVSILFYSFCSTCFISALFVPFCANPIFSALFLILSFCNVAVLLFFLKLEFLPIIFIMLYVGAIIVLFLFVLMLLNINTFILNQPNYDFLPVFIILLLIFFFELNFVNFLSNKPLIMSNFSPYFLIDFIFDCPINFNVFVKYSVSDNIKSIGHLLFSFYAIYFIIAGFILLIALVGSIVLTLRKKFIINYQIIYNQLLRSYKILYLS